MYGMVNKAVEEMVTGRFGEEIWEKVRTEAGIIDEEFISNETYPDEVTYRLVGAASRVLEMKPEEVLEKFGEHWILHTAPEGYGELLTSVGTSFPEFLLKLPTFHTRIALIFPKMTPPEFAITDLCEASLRLHYYSRRSGLKPFVVGLLQGLGTMFAVAVTISILNCREQGADHEVFLVEWRTLP